MPLAGRRMKPFAKAVAQNLEGFARSVQTGGGTTQIVLNGAVLNDDAAMRSAARGLLVELARKADV